MRHTLTISAAKVNVIKKMKRYTMKIALIGDSILDNEEYTGEADSVFTKVKQKLPDCEVINFAEDGITSLDINPQLDRVKT